MTTTNPNSDVCLQIAAIRNCIGCMMPALMIGRPLDKVEREALAEAFDKLNSLIWWEEPKTKP